MIKLPPLLRRFWRSDDGAMMVPYLLAAPVVLGIVAASVEIGLYTARNAMLERGLDIAVRQIRINTEEPPTYDAVVGMICDTAAIIPKCNDNLHLQMKKYNVRTMGSISFPEACAPLGKEFTPANKFENGMDNELMIIRACWNFKPVFPAHYVGRTFDKDGDGQAYMLATSAFVQEPR